MTTYIVINKETLTIPFRTREMRIASEAADLVCPDHASRISELNNAAFSCFTEYELIVLYKNVMGEPITIRPYGELIKAVRFAAEEKIPVDPHPYEVWLKRAKEAFPDAPPEMLRPLAPPPASPHPVPAILGGSGEPQGATQVKEKAQVKPKDTSAQKDDNQRPKPGGKTAKVWEIGDSLIAQLGATPPSDSATWKSIRAALTKRCEEEGLNPGMVATQYGRWKKSILGG